MAALTRETIDQEHLVARYARGSLSEQEREAFEDYCVLHPEVAEQVKTDRALIEGMRELEGESRVEPKVSLVRYWAMAAGIAAAIAIGTWLAFNPQGNVALYAANGRESESLASRLSEPMRLAQQRGTVVILSVTPVRNVLEVQIVTSNPPSPAPASVTLVELTDQGERVLNTVNVLPSQRDGEWVLNVLIDTQSLSASNLRLDVEHGGARESFRVRVLHRP
jgi:hypothetical protein